MWMGKIAKDVLVLGFATYSGSTDVIITGSLKSLNMTLKYLGLRRPILVLACGIDWACGILLYFVEVSAKYDELQL